MEIRHLDDETMALALDHGLDLFLVSLFNFTKDHRVNHQTRAERDREEEEDCALWAVGCGLGNTYAFFKELQEVSLVSCSNFFADVHF